VKDNTLENEFSWGFDEAYAAIPCVFGQAADQFLALNLQFVHRGQALDLGCGEGRNVRGRGVASCLLTHHGPACRHGRARARL